MTGTAVVVAFERNRPGWLLNQHGGLVRVVAVERADGENPLSAALPVLLRTQFRAVLPNPRIQIKDLWCVSCLDIDTVFDTVLRHNIKELVRRDCHNILWYGDDFRHSVRTRWDTVAFAVLRAGQSPNPCRVMNGEVDFDRIGRGFRHFRNHTLNQSAVIRRQVNAVHELSAVAGVRHNWSGPAERG